MRRAAIVIATGMIACVAGWQPAAATELPVKAPAYAPQSFSWTGCFFGAHLGGGWGNKAWTLTTTNTPFNNYDVSGVVGGGQVGCDYQTGIIVLGAQFDYGWSNLDGSGVQIGAPGQSERTNISSIASVTGRLGFAWDRWLTFIRGGAAWAPESHDIFVTATGATLASRSETRSGWTVGIGGEYALTNNLSGFVEFNYYDFGSKTLTFPAPLAIDQNLSVLKGGLNYRFNWFSPLTHN